MAQRFIRPIKFSQKSSHWIGFFFLFSFLATFGLFGRSLNLTQEIKRLLEEKRNLKQRTNELRDEVNFLRNQDQYLINQGLEREIENIHKNYLELVELYERLLDLKLTSRKNTQIEELFASILKFLAERNYASAEASLTELAQRIQEEQQAVVLASNAATNLPLSNSPPSSGFQRQKVKTDVGTFTVSIISADLNSTRVIVDTASESDCFDNCPVLSLGEYVSRNGAFAGVNGSYFCPSAYPSCANKKNTFDTLLMNKNKKYFNSDNNVYSTVPAVIFSGNSARFVAQSLEWGRDTSVDAVIANQPLLVFNNAIVFGGDSDPKHSNKGGRSFVGVTGSMVYVGVVHSATLAESAKVLQTLGIHHALNLDDGGSTALWYSGYKVGPGRNIPNAVLFVKK